MSDRITDNTGLFYARLRAESPRAKRLRTLAEVLRAEFQERASAVAGAGLLVLIFIVFALV